MFGISLGEIVLIGVIALVVLGPEQLPGVAHKSGKLLAKLKAVSDNLKNKVYTTSGIIELNNFKLELQSQLDYIKSQVRPGYGAGTYMNDYAAEDKILYQGIQFLYQPEFDFDREPELFDEIS